MKRDSIVFMGEERFVHNGVLKLADLGITNEILDNELLGKLKLCNCITVLKLGFNKINDLCWLENLPHLVELNLGGNNITEITGLEKLTLI